MRQIMQRLRNLILRPRSPIGPLTRQNGATWLRRWPSPGGLRSVPTHRTLHRPCRQVTSVRIPRPFARQACAPTAGRDSVRLATRLAARVCVVSRRSRRVFSTSPVAWNLRQSLATEGRPVARSPRGAGLLALQSLLRGFRHSDADARKTRRCEPQATGPGLFAWVAQRL